MPNRAPYAVLEASGHVGEFSDFMTECGSCGEASRADTLLEPHHPNPDALKRDELQDLLFKFNRHVQRVATKHGARSRHRI